MGEHLFYMENVVVRFHLGVLGYKNAGVVELVDTTVLEAVALRV